MIGVRLLDVERDLEERMMIGSRPLDLDLDLVPDHDRDEMTTGGGTMTGAFPDIFLYQLGAG
jgi:hypothetical protein